MRDLLTISDRNRAAVFASPLQGKIVQTLIGEELTLSALGRVTQTPLSLLHYHLSKCLALGLVEIAREQPRAGRAIKYYRATAKTFFVPSDLLARLPGAEMTRQLREALDRNQASSVEGVNFTHDGLNPFAFLVKDPASRTTAIELWLDIGLGSADIVELIKDLEAVLNRYRARGNEGLPRHLVHLAMARAQQ